MLSNQTNKVLEKLVATYLSKGVQPSDIVDTMFEEHYVDMNIKKSSDSLVMTYSFEEVDDNDQINCISMKYTYSKSMYLQSVEQKVGKGRYKVQWDRSEDLKTTVKKLIQLTGSEDNLNQIIKTVPCEIQKFIKTPLVA
ncbi:MULTISPECIES: hypothetical protein [Vibrio]|uniref:hypothetical protein n=1 Tax=Vibrio TaxID=662 RepID=UPI0018697A80|nr:MULTISPECIES: hypothetical protein [Vibrio]EJB1785768.1 hypothetical protein [Vibrio parahaemolyticus]MBE4082661.1 hypothetical protein [Vibrio parahaemolyticus]MDW2080580.1 hypothetical protein [Vibrio sp. 1640]MEA5370712.1 hypothetical protein [Vibrio parahaemolyticus]